MINKLTSREKAMQTISRMRIFRLPNERIDKQTEHQYLIQHLSKIAYARNL